MRKLKPKQQETIELESIIKAFGDAMRSANRKYVSLSPNCQHDGQYKFTLGMHGVWQRYIEFCRTHLENEEGR